MALIEAKFNFFYWQSFCNVVGNLIKRKFSMRIIDTLGDSLSGSIRITKSPVIVKLSNFLPSDNIALDDIAY